MSYRRKSPLAAQALDRMDERWNEVHLRAQEGLDRLVPIDMAALVDLVDLRSDEYHAYEEEGRRAHPHAQALAHAIAVEQPEWAESEECDVVLLQVTAALDKLGLKLVAQE